MKMKIDSFQTHATLLALVLAALMILAAGAVAGTAATPERVNINTADSGEMATLPGIGQSKAQAIVEYRSEHGPFPTIESLANVRGIGMKVLDKIRPFLTIQ